MTSINTLNDRVALVTGSAQSIGKTIAQRLAQSGAKVVISDINIEQARETEEEFREQGLQAMSVQLDVSNEDSICSGVALIKEQFGAVDILVNNAGILRKTPVLEMTLGDWDLSADITLKGALMCARAVLPAMQKQKWGRVVNMGSMMSSTAYGSDVAYCTVKAGILGMTRSMAAEFGPDNICVNTVCPGNIKTPMLDQVARNAEARDGLEAGEFYRQRESTIPLRRLGVPEDIANVTAFLCSSDADYVSGQALHVNGGLYYN